MKNYVLLFLILAISLLSIPAMSQTADDEELLGLPGDNLDLYATLDLFQKSKTIEDFEKSLNEEGAGINNLDLNLDDKVDFIKVTTKQDKKDFSFILQVDIGENEIQDVAVILVSKDKEDNVTMQVVGDKDLYGKDFVVEPKPAVPATTVNPGYAGTDPVVVEAAPTTVVVVQSAPIVQYVYSPVYVPYAPPYYYGYYPPYFRASVVVGVSIYRHNNYYHHNNYHGGRGNTTVVVHNHNSYNNYNSNRRTSNTVNRNNSNGNYNRNNQSSRPSNGSSTRPSNGSKTRPSNGSKTRPSNGSSTRPSTSPSRGSSAATRPSTRPSSSTSRPSRSSSPSRLNSSPSRSGGGASRGGGGGGRRR